MKPIAFLTSADLLPECSNRREDAWEFDLQFGALEKDCAELGLRLQPAVWRSPEFNAADYSAVFIGTAWDYAEAPEEFLATLESIQHTCPLLNPLETVEWNMDKTYLRDLQERGVPVVPTLWFDDASQATVEGAFDHFECDKLVIKPLVGANAWRQAKVTRGQDWPTADELPPGPCLVQPFLKAAMEDEPCRPICPCKLYSSSFSSAGRRENTIISANGHQLRMRSRVQPGQEVLDAEEEEEAVGWQKEGGL